jgi:hypothetical protein
MTVEDSKVSFSQVLGTLPFIALHRQRDPGETSGMQGRLGETSGFLGVIFEDGGF